jgi:hypothetical protein
MTHQLVNARTGQVLDLPTWEWADLDNGRLVWAERGCLFRGQCGSSGLKSVKQLYDFNDLRFEKIAAPY